MSLTQIIWEACGRPDHGRPSHQARSARPCCICGDSITSGVASAHGISKTYSNFRELRSIASGLVCDACVWAMAGRPPLTLRLWSVLWREDGHTLQSSTNCPWQPAGVRFTNKGDIEDFQSVLLDPPRCKWGMSIADGGKIHVLPFAPINAGNSDGWRVRIDDLTVSSSGSEFSAITKHAAILYDLGFSKTDILSGQPQPSSLKKHGVDEWRQHHSCLRPWFRSVQLRLALFFLRREHRNG